MPRSTKTLADRLWSRVVEQPNGCWDYQGTRNPDGYGRISYRGRQIGAHRAAIIVTLGSILRPPAGWHCIIDAPGLSWAQLGPGYLTTLTTTPTGLELVESWHEGAELRWSITTARDLEAARRDLPEYRAALDAACVAVVRWGHTEGSAEVRS